MNTKSADRSPRADVLAIHVVAALSRAGAKGGRITLEDVAREVGARKADVRAVVTKLDRQGFVDAQRMRLTLLGFALGMGIGGAGVRELRPRAAVARRPLPVAA